MRTVPPALQVSQPPGLAFHTSGRARSSLTGGLWSLVNVSTSVLLTAFVFLVTSRVLSPAEFGAVALASAIVALVGALVRLPLAKLSFSAPICRSSIPTASSG